MNLVSRLIENAGRHPERLALVDRRRGKDREVSYAELVKRVRAGASELEAMGLRRGEVVLVFQPVTIELYEILLASFYLGLQVMLVDPLAGRGFLARCCERVSPAAFFGTWKAQCLRWMVPGMRRIPVSISVDAWVPFSVPWRVGECDAVMVDVSADEAALVTFTSGSTGQPKAAVRSHGFLLAQHRALASSLDFQEGEVDLVTLPVFVLANLASGLTSVLAATDLRRPGSPEVVGISEQCEKFRVTRCAASPAFFEGFLRSGVALPQFEKIFTGGAPVLPDVLKRLSERLPAAKIHSVYGSTEAEPIAHFSSAGLDEAVVSVTRRGGGLCAGFAVPEVGLRILTDRWGAPLSASDFHESGVPEGEVGEIIVSGEHVLRGYLGGLGDEETKICVGEAVWHRTGDAGWLDRDGRLWLLGRCAEKLAAFSGEEGVPREALRYPFGIECALREMFPERRMAAVDWKMWRVLVVGGGRGSEELESIRFHAARLGMEHVLVMDELPLDRRHQAKVDYVALRERLKDVSW